jgi:conjugal transfer pilus assembly protein TraD
MRSYQDMFRPNYEMAATTGWGLGTIALAILQPPMWVPAVVGAVGMGVWRWNQAMGLYRFRLSISIFRADMMDVSSLVRVTQSMLKKQDLWLGRGFVWSQKHAEIARHILVRNADELPTIPSWFPSRAIQWLAPKNQSIIREDEGKIGVPWIHGIGADEERDIPFPLESLTGHTAISGTTRTGKTRFYEMLTTEIIHTQTGAALICIDPKGDKDWKRRLEWESRRSGRKFLLFDPADPDNSIRLNPLTNWNNLSEPATRIGQLIDADGSFAAFAWKTLYRVMRGMVADGQRPDIKRTKRYVEMGVDGLLDRLLTKLFDAHEGVGNWRHLLSKQGAGKLTEVEMMANKYASEYMEAGLGDEAIDGLVAMVRHSKEHYSKMVQVLEPILEMLGSGEIGDMLSPDPLDHNDQRPIYDMKRIIDEKAVLYMALDSLSDKIVGSAIASIALADIASSTGAAYNFGEKTNVYLMIDEAAEVINDQTIQILNKGGGAGVKGFLAFQATADMEARFGGKAKALMALANLNNVITFRLKDPQSAQWISEMFPNTIIRSESASYSSGSDSSSAFTEFKGSVSRNLKETDAPLVPVDLLIKLPPLNFFAFIAAQKVWKGRVPLLESPDDEARRLQGKGVRA